MKPIGASQGKGIFLFRKLADINKWKTEYKWSHSKQEKEKTDNVEQYVVRKYLSNPMLVGGKTLTFASTPS